MITSGDVLQRLLAEPRSSARGNKAGATPLFRRRGIAAKPMEEFMFGWAITFLIVALIAAVLGFGGIATFAVDIARIIFFVAIVLLVISVIVGLVRGRTPTVP
jgi:uncharacterized membrane protein YtjA (UPF0391 family)